MIGGGKEPGVVAAGEVATVNHVILDGAVIILTDGRVLTICAQEVQVTNTWLPSIGLEIWKTIQSRISHCVSGICLLTKRFVDDGQRA